MSSPSSLVSRLDPADVGGVNSVFFGDVNLPSRVGLDCGNLLIRQLASPVGKSIIVPAFFCSIFVVVIFCSKLKMVWINARRVVALVHNDHSFWNRAIDKFKHVTMCSYWFFAGKKENSVPVSVLCSRPLPTSRVKFFVLIMENIIRPNYRKLMQSFSIPHAVVMVAAKLSSYCFGITKNALDKTLGLVSHNRLLVGSGDHSICLFDGSGKL